MNAATAAQIKNAAASILMVATTPGPKKSADALAAAHAELVPRYRSAREVNALAVGLDSARRRLATTGSIAAALASLGV